MKGINIGSFMSSQNIHVLLLNARLISCGFINLNRLCWFIFVILIYKSDLQIQNRINAKKTQCESHKSLYLHIFSILKKTARGKARAAISKSQRVGFRVTAYFKEGYITF